MAIEQRENGAPDDIVALAVTRPDPQGLVLYPDRVSPIGDDLVAGFRDDAQELRVAAIDAGIPVDVALPDGTRAGQYTEHAADWVLSLIAVPTSVVATLVATSLQRRLDAWQKQRSGTPPTVRYREVVSKNDGQTIIREIEGPASEVIEWLREERGGRPELGPGDDQT